jgi:hypothetical protein
MMSIGVDRDLKRDALRAGARGHLEKPMSGDDILGLIRKVHKLETRRGSTSSSTWREALWLLSVKTWAKSATETASAGAEPRGLLQKVKRPGSLMEFLRIEGPVALVQVLTAILLWEYARIRVGYGMCGPSRAIRELYVYDEQEERRSRP